MPKFPKDLWKSQDGNWSYILTIVLPEHTFIQRQYREVKTISDLYGSQWKNDCQTHRNYEKQFKIIPDTGWMVQKWAQTHYNDDSTYDEGPSVSHYTFHDWRVAFCEIDPKVLEEKDGRYTSFTLADDLGTALVKASEYFKEYFPKYGKKK